LYVPLLQRPKTYFIDIDGVIIKQGNRWPTRTYDPREFEPIAGSVAVINDLFTAGHSIILTTARAEPYRPETEYQLKKLGLQFDALLMGLPTGQRILINDRKPQEEIDTAIAINLDRDTGLAQVEL
jgi:hypothetical protein